MKYKIYFCCKDAATRITKLVEKVVELERQSIFQNLKNKIFTKAANILADYNDEEDHIYFTDKKSAKAYIKACSDKLKNSYIFAICKINKNKDINFLYLDSKE